MGNSSSLHATLDVKLENVNSLIAYEHIVGEGVNGAQFQQEIEKKWGLLSPQVKGLIALIEYYLYSFSRSVSPHEQGPKALLGLLVRNNFHAIYEQRLNEKQQREFAEVYVNTRENQDAPIFPGGYKLGSIKIPGKYSLSIGDWLQSIIKGDPEENKYDLGPEFKGDEDKERIEGRGKDRDALSPPPGYTSHKSGEFSYSMGREALAKDTQFI